MNLAYATQVTYTESGSLQTDLNYFKGTDDEEMDEIHTARNQFGADVCVLIVASAGGPDAGLAANIPADFGTAFCVARYDCAVSQITFAHEIGHLLGGRHQYGVDPNGTYNHGYYHYDPTPENRWLTVMAIPDDKWGPTNIRIWFWSDGSAYGDANSNNVLQLNTYAPTISAFNTHVVSGVISTNTTWSENTYLGGNVTVASAITLTISPGITVTAQGNYKLRVEGTLVANGQQGNEITFQGSGSSGSWFGIEFYNAPSGQSLSYCTIKDASYGLNFINSSFASTHLTIKDNTYGVSCTNYSDPTFNNTVFQTDSWGVNGDATSAPSLTAFTGYNSFRTNDYYDIYSTYSGTIYARGNWWGACSPSPSVTGNVDYSSELCVDPNPERIRQIADSPLMQLSKASSSSFASTKIESGMSGKDPGMNQLEAAYRLYLDGKYEQALQAFERNVSKYPEYFAGERSLVFVERTLEKLGRSTEILASLNNTATTYRDKLVGKTAAARRTYEYIRQGDYQNAVAQATEVVQQNTDTTLVKFSLYDLGSIYWYSLGDTKNGAQYYGQLIARFPNDPLSHSAEVTLGLSIGKPAKQAGLTTTSSLSTEYDLQNYPNPFNPSTTISYQLTAKGSVSLRIYNMLGQEVAALVDGERLPGYHQEMWDASRNPSGVYVYQLIATDEKGQKQVARKRMLLLK